MPAAVRIKDAMKGAVGHHNGHLCPFCCGGHGVSGQQMTGSLNVYLNGSRAARVGDSGVSTCPCCGRGYTNVKGSKKVFFNGKPAVRVGDMVDVHGQGTGTMVSGSPNVFIHS